MLDQTDKQIIKLLKENSRLRVSEIAQKVHLTAPAVSARLQKLEDKGTIKGYTVEIDRSQFGCPVHVVVTVTLKEPNHAAYQAYIGQYQSQVGFHYRTAGVGCYLLEVFFEDNQALSDFLDGLETYAGYQISSVVNVVKE
ncbi:Lrp/AsnC family transcriptional regulator [Streptococcus cameli]